ncbi:MAG: hypothetical protein AAGA56_25795, partial [Myxococcota bacterium]
RQGPTLWRRDCPFRHGFRLRGRMLVGQRRLLPAALLVATLTLGCGERERSTPTQPSAASPPRRWVGRLGGQPFPLPTWLAYSRGGRSVHLFASTHPVGCDDLTPNGFVAEAGEAIVELTIAPLLRPDGTETWSLRGARLGSLIRQGDFGAVEIAMGSDKKPRLDRVVALKAEIPFPDGAGRPPKVLAFDGEIKPRACGVKRASSRAKPAPQNDLTTTIAGKRVVFRGATYKGGKLLLSTQPHSCKNPTGSDISLAILTSESGAVQARLSGSSFTRIMLAEAPSLTVTAPPSEDAGPAVVGLGGDVDVQGYKVTLEGEARAHRCPAGGP